MNQKGFANLNIILVLVVIVLLGTTGYFIFVKNPLSTPKISQLKEIVDSKDLVSIDEARKIADNYLDLVPDSKNSKIILNEEMDTWYSLDGLTTAYIFYGKTEGGKNAYLAIAGLKTIRPYWCGSSISPDSIYQQILKTSSYKEKRYLYLGSPVCVPFLELTSNSDQKSYYLFALNGEPSVTAISERRLIDTQSNFYNFVSKSNTNDFGRESREIWTKID